MKQQKCLITIIFFSVVSLVACSTPQQPLSVHPVPGQPQKPSGCIMQAGQCKPVNTSNT